MEEASNKATACYKMLVIWESDISCGDGHTNVAGTKVNCLFTHDSHDCGLFIKVWGRREEDSILESIIIEKRRRVELGVGNGRPF